MINLDYITLKLFVEENKNFLVGARLQKIQQPTRRDFVFSFRNLSESKKLYVNINPDCFHTCFTTDNNLKRRDIEYPKKPPMFCMLLRKYIENAKILDVRVPIYERIIEIDFKSINEFDNNINLTLAIEVMGKYSNIILYNSETKIILGCAHNVGSEKSRQREVAGTIPYIYPPEQKYKKDILRYTGNINYKTLNQDFLGISMNFQDSLEKKQVPLEKIKDYILGEATISPAIDNNLYSVYSELLDNPVHCSSISEMIDEYYSKIQESICFNRIMLKLKNIINAKYKKTTGSLKKISYQLDKKNKCEKYKKYGDLILAHLYNNKDFSDSITVIDWDTLKEIIIPLDKELTLKENSQKYYKLFAKSKDSKEKLDSLFTELQNEKEYLEQVLYTIDNADSLNVLKDIDDEVNTQPETKKTENTEVESVKINGFKVYIGKNNRQNDLIISKLSKGEDYWFHTQNTPGSHILLKVTDNNEPDEETIYECCKLAKRYSTAAESTKAGVIYTKRKFIKKPPKANLGYVIYKNEKEIIVN